MELINVKIKVLQWKQFYLTGSVLNFKHNWEFHPLVPWIIESIRVEHSVAWLKGQPGRSTHLVVKLDAPTLHSRNENFRSLQYPQAAKAPVLTPDNRGL